MPSALAEAAPQPGARVKDPLETQHVSSYCVIFHNRPAALFGATAPLLHDYGALFVPSDLVRRFKSALFVFLTSLMPEICDQSNSSSFFGFRFGNLVK